MNEEHAAKRGERTWIGKIARKGRSGNRCFRRGQCIMPAVETGRGTEAKSRAEIRLVGIHSAGAEIEEKARFNERGSAGRIGLRV